MVRLYSHKDDCCGCTACMSICPRQAITMKPDENGFLYPTINKSLCIECELCRRVCAFQNDIKSSPVEREPIATYAAILKDVDFLKNSASGGVFVALALYVLNNNGVVFGCAMNDNMKAEHICIDNMLDIKKLQGSKYVQSDLNSTFNEAKRYLEKNRQVLFTGTPCQIAGLKLYLGKNYDNLITIDLICHGVPSPLFFKEYISWLEKKLKATVINFKFRDKGNSLSYSHIGKVIYKKNNKLNKKLIYPIKSCYYHYFLKGYIFRGSCYKCPYANSNRQGDFTIGDYWGIQKIHPDIDAKQGVSLMLVNNKKSIKLIDSLGLIVKDTDNIDFNNDGKCNNYMYLIESDFQKARIQNCQLNYPTPNNNRRDIILRTFREEGFKNIADKYYSEMKREIMAWRIKAIIPRSIKDMIKKMLRKS